MRVLVVTGEASGDAHAAKVVRHLRAAGAEVAAVGGPALAATGARILERVEALTVVGFVEVLARMPRLVALKRRLDAGLQAGEYDLALLVDYAGFNLRIAASAHRAGVPVLYFVGPQVWAWRAHRLRAMRERVDHVALILPFEKPHYDAAGVPATFVGHPLLDDPRGVAVEPDRDLGLFPGSRPQEIAAHLPVLLATAARLQRSRPGLRLLVSQAPTVDAAAMQRRLRAAGFDPDAVLVSEATGVAMRRCRALLVVSGTATLEAALAERPFAVLYRTSGLTFAVARRLVRVPSVALANLVAGERVVREYLQGDANPAALAAEAARLLDDPVERERILAGVRHVRERLGPPGGPARVAALAYDVVRRAGPRP